MPLKQLKASGTGFATDQNENRGGQMTKVEDKKDTVICYGMHTNSLDIQKETA